MAATIDGKPIIRFASHNEGHVQVVDAVSHAIAYMEVKKPQQNVHNASPALASPMFQAKNTVFTPRSSNLSLPMSFTDLDKDRAAVRGLSMSLVILKTH